MILVYLLGSRWSIRIRQFAESFSPHNALQSWVTIAIYVLAVGAIFKVFELPLNFYSGYVLEHRFGLSRQSLGGWIKDQAKARAPKAIREASIAIAPQFAKIVDEPAFLDKTLISRGLVPAINTPAEFAELKRIALDLGFGHVESGPLVRSSYHAHEQADSLAAARGAATVDA